MTLLQQALEALESRCGTNAEERKTLIPALRAAIAALRAQPDHSELVKRLRKESINARFDAFDAMHAAADALEGKAIRETK